MGRRAKNKQGDPESLRDPKEHISSKKLGKRKANPVSDQRRPAKKVKDSARLVSEKNVKRRRSGKEESSDDSEESWGGIDDHKRDDVWDDEDEDAVPVQSRCVISCSSGSTAHSFKR